MDIRKTDEFSKWLDGLTDIQARARVMVRIERLAMGNPGDVKGRFGTTNPLRARLPRLLQTARERVGDFVGRRGEGIPIPGYQNRTASC